MTPVLELLQYDFMIRALLGAVFTGLAAPAVGTYLVQRRLALMGDGIGHIAVTGVAVGLLTGASPTLTAVIVAVIGAVVIETIRALGCAISLNRFSIAGISSVTSAFPHGPFTSESAKSV